MIEILLIIILLIGVAVLFLQFQNKSNPTDVKFQTSLDEKIKLIHDEIGRNRSPPVRGEIRSLASLLARRS